MATATKKDHTARSRVAAARAVSGTSSLAFLIDQDNSGDYHWEIVDSRGTVLVHSGSFASPDDAERAARHVQRGAGTARFEPGIARDRPTVVA
jgi:hypothetical protein